MAHSGPAMNFHRISSKLATGGHFTGDGISALKDQGVSLVIDLRNEPPDDQAQRLEAADIRYINVPVVWKAPEAEDFATFARHMAENQGEHIFVQCQANYRASAMTYAYRVGKDGVPENGCPGGSRSHLDAGGHVEGLYRRHPRSGRCGKAVALIRLVAPAQCPCRRKRSLRICV